MRRGCLPAFLVIVLFFWSLMVTWATFDYLLAIGQEPMRRHEEMAPIILEPTVHPPRTIMWNGHETCPC